MKGIATILLAFLSQAALAEQCQNATPEQIEATKAKVISEPLAKSSGEEGYLKVITPKGERATVINYFTLSGHPAHPSHVISAVYESGGQIWLQSRGFTAGNCAAFQQWLQAFAAQHEKVKMEFSPKEQGK